jgi:hypothetical protein
MYRPGRQGPAVQFAVPPRVKYVLCRPARGLDMKQARREHDLRRRGVIDGLGGPRPIGNEARRRLASQTDKNPPSWRGLPSFGRGYHPRIRSPLHDAPNPQTSAAAPRRSTTDGRSA